MREAFIIKKFTKQSQVIVARVNSIVEEYVAKGYRMTLRQLYYQLVARGFVQNVPREYDRLTWLLNDARLAGIVDWDAIEDRGRVLRGIPHWESPKQVLDECVDRYAVDMWVGQTYRPEVWVEKDALLGVIRIPANKWDTPFFSCRGYTSVTSLYDTFKRFIHWESLDQVPIVIHLGDHDPSGVDMTRDIFDRLEKFQPGFEVRRIALTMKQIRKYNPPPNPVKLTDSRHQGYIKEFGDECWELDALDPVVLDNLISKTIEKLVDKDEWGKRLKLQEQGRRKLKTIAKSLAPKKRKPRRKKKIVRKKRR